MSLCSVHPLLGIIVASRLDERLIKLSVGVLFAAVVLAMVNSCQEVSSCTELVFVHAAFVQ